MSFFLHLKQSASVTGEKVFQLGDGITSAGSLKSADIWLEKTAAQQFELVRQNGSVILQNQAEGTILNGEILPKDARQKLEINDEIFFGDYTFVFNQDKIITDFNGLSLKKKRFPPAHNTIIAVQSKAQPKNETAYLEIDNKGLGIKKLELSAENISLGWSKKGEIITANQADIETELVWLKKDWSGIIAYPQMSKTVWINGQRLKSPQKLANQDVLTFSIKKGLPESKGIKVAFVEPPPSVSVSSFADDFWFNGESEADLTNSVLFRSHLKTIEKKHFLVNTGIIKFADKKSNFLKKPIVETKPIEPKKVVEIEIKPIELKKIEPTPSPAKPIEIKKVEPQPIFKIEQNRVVEKPIEKTPIIQKPITVAKPVTAKPQIVEKKFETKRVERKPLEIGKKISYVKDEVLLPKLSLFAGKTKTQFVKFSTTFRTSLSKIWATSNGWSQTAFSKVTVLGKTSWTKSKNLTGSASGKLIGLREPARANIQKFAQTSKNVLQKGAKTSSGLKTRIVEAVQTNLPKLKTKSAILFSFVGNRLGAGLKFTGDGVKKGARTLGESVSKAKDVSVSKVTENFDALKTQTSNGLSSLKTQTAEKISQLKTNTSAGVSSLKNQSSNGMSAGQTQFSKGLASFGELKTKLVHHEFILRMIKNEFVQLISATAIGSVAVFLILQLLIP